MRTNAYRVGDRVMWLRSDGRETACSVVGLNGQNRTVELRAPDGQRYWVVEEFLRLDPLAPKPVEGLSTVELNRLRDLIGACRYGDRSTPDGMRRAALAEQLGRLDHRIGVQLGCDPYVLYQDMLFCHRNYLIEPDGSINLNGAEGVLAEYGESDLNMAERVLADWRDRGLTD